MSGLLERFRSGDRQALARILTNIENESVLGDDALRALAGDTGKAHLVGLTGPPGAGKSTLANQIVKAMREQGKRIAVLAIDPSSPLTGGAMLGDRIRMLESQHDNGVYLRSMASRGQIGGLTLAAFGSAMALDAFGFDVVLIETVGAGQDEVDIARLADTVILVQTPGMGDSIQAVKAGVLEIADILVVNKADLAGADQVVRDLREQVRTGRDDGWRIPVVPTSSERATGIVELLAEVEKHHAFVTRTYVGDQKQLGRTIQHAKMLAMRELTRYLCGGFSQPEVATDPAHLAAEMIDSFIKSRRSRP